MKNYLALSGSERRARAKLSLTEKRKTEVPEAKHKKFTLRK